MYTLPSTLDRARTLFPTATVSDGTTTTRSYDDVHRRTRELAGGLADRGVERGDVVAVADWNTPTFFELLYAATGLGAVVYPVNLNLPPEQIGYTLKKSGATWLVHSEDFAELGANFGGPTVAASDLTYDDPVEFDIAPDDPAVMLFTSGTTGQPKAIRYTHEEMTQGALSIAHQLTEFDTPASLSGDSTLIPAIPLFHILAWGSVVIAPYLGADLVLPGQFDPAETAELVEDADDPWSNMVPTMVKQLLATDANLEGLHLLTGGSAIERSLVTQMNDHGIDFSTIYGGTDMLAAAISIWTPAARAEGPEYLRDVMHPVPFGSFRLKHHEGMDEDMGELQFRAPWLPDGYYEEPEKTAAAFEDGWFNTGDVGRRTDDGGIQVLDRLDDAIKSGGEWIPTSVLESVLSEFEGVQQTAILGKPDEEWGERPVAIVSLVDDRALDDDALRTHMEAAADAGRINEWWIPEEFHDVEEMPLTSTGKIQKTELRDRFDLD